MQDIKIVREPLPVQVLKKMAEGQFTDMIKAVVDIEKEIIAVGGSLHADEEKELLSDGSIQQNLWGYNIYFEVEEQDRIEFDSMINIRPTQGNKSRDIEDLTIREKIIAITNRLIIF